MLRRTGKLAGRVLKFIRDLHPRPVCRIQVFMRSGNSIVLDGVTEYEIDTKGLAITRFSLVQKTSMHNSYLLVSTLDLTQIEAVVRLPRR